METESSFRNVVVLKFGNINAGQSSEEQFCLFTSDEA
jgi:hypothetical protein